MQAQRPTLITHRYQLIDKLGSGGMGAVFRAQDLVTGQVVALKQVFINPQQLQFASKTDASDPTMMLAQEFKFMASLHHPNIISVLDYGFDFQSRPYYTMTLLEEADGLVAGGRRCDLQGKIDLLLQLLQALAYLHRRRILHRDLKPSNVMVCKDKQLKVVDFGVAAAADHVDSRAGTVFYMAPEVLRGQSASIQSDLYAVGIMAFELFAGHRPFDAATPVARLYKALREPLNIQPLLIAPELIAIIKKLLAPAVEDRYRSAEDAMQALAQAAGQPLRIETQATRESFLQAATFVGRQKEFDWLMERLYQAMNSKGNVVIIGGESGVGKSRLVDEIASNAMVKQMLVLRGQGVEGGGLFYQLWRDPLRRLILSSELGDLEAGILSVAVPDISRLLGRAIPDIPDLPGEAGKQRFILTVRDLFLRQQQPLLLILEDLQWAHESLTLMQSLSSAVQEHPILILGTYRSDEGSELLGLLPRAELLTLARLDHAAVAALSLFMLGDAGSSPEVVKLIERETEGNAFFMVEVVRALAEEAGRLSNVGESALPTGILTQGMDQIVQRRLNRAPQNARPFLNLAAVVGRILDMKLIEILYQEGLESVLTDCANAGVLENQDGAWRFAHDKLRDGLLVTLPGDDLQSLHRQVAEGLEMAYPNDIGYTEMLADHWEAAGDKLKAVEYITQMVQQLINLVADYYHAERFIERGLSLLDEQHPAQRVPLLVLLGDAVAKRSAYAEATRHYEASLAEYTPEILNRIHAHNGLSYIAWRQGDNDMALRHAEHALKLARQIDDKQQIAATLNNLGNNVLWFRGDFATARELLEESLAVERELGDKLGMAASLAGLGGAAWLQGGQFTMAHDYYEQSLAISREIGDKLGIATSLHGVGLALMQGENPAAREYYAESVAIKREIGDKFGIAMSLHGLAKVAWIQGESTTARQFFDEALAISHEIGGKLFIALCLNGLAMFAHFQGDYEQASGYYKESLAITEETNIPDVRIQSLAGCALLYIDTGQLTEAARALEEGIPLVRQYNYATRQGVFMISAAAWIHQQGDTLTAAAWLGLVGNNIKFLVENRAQYTHVAAKLALALGAEDFDAALERGKLVDIDQLFDDLARRLEG